MTNDASIKAVLDSLQVPWDDPLRGRAVEFARRTPEEQNLWLFVEVTRLKPSRTPAALNAVYTSVVAAVVAIVQVLR